MKDIAEHYGVGQTVVWSRIHEHGITLEGVGKGGHRKRTGSVLTEEHRKNIAKSYRPQSGSDNPNWRGGPVSITCQNCEGNFYVRRARANNAKYCGTQCHGQAKAQRIQGKDHPRWQTDAPRVKENAIR